MHYCLRIPEIADLICKNVHRNSKNLSGGNRDDYDSDGDCDLPGSDLGSEMPKCATLALAQTCKHFYEPAMSALWSSLDGLRPLVRCMDRALYDIKEDEETMVLKVLLRPIHASDIAILKKYTPRIRHLRVYEILTSTSVPVEVYHALTIHFGGQLWIPNLHTLDLNLSGESTSILPFVGFIMGPLLNTLKVWASFNSDDKERHDLTLTSLLTTIPSRLPYLTSVDLSLLYGMSSVVSTLIQKCHRLVHIDVGMLNGPAIRHLSTLLSLRELRITGGFEDQAGAHESATTEATDLSAHDETPAFPSLRKLTLTYLERFSDYIQFFSYLKTEIRLTELKIVVEDNWSLEEIQKLVPVVSQGVAAETLRNLFIHVAEDPDVGHPEISPRSTEILKPLKKFTWLESLLFMAQPQPYISDNDIKDLCSAWPKLLELHISNTVIDMAHPGESITLQAVMAAGSSCPKLSALTLAFDARQDKLPDADKTISKTLTSLNVADSYIDDFVKVAHLLYKMFPRLRVETNPPDIDDNEEELAPSEAEIEWIKVDVLLKQLRQQSIQSKEARKKGRKQCPIEAQASVDWQ